MLERGFASFVVVGELVVVGKTSEVEIELVVVCDEVVEDLLWDRAVSVPGMVFGLELELEFDFVLVLSLVVLG